MNGESSVDSEKREKTGAATRVGNGDSSADRHSLAVAAASTQVYRRPRRRLTQHLVAVMFTDYSYNKPWLATWLCTSSFSLYLIRPALHAWRRKRRRRRGSLAPLPFLDTLARVVSKDDDDGDEDDEIPE